MTPLHEALFEPSAKVKPKEELPIKFSIIIISVVSKKSLQS